MIPGLYDGRNKAFFFFHYEQIRFPNSFTRTRTVYNAARRRRLVPLPVRHGDLRRSTCCSWRPPTARSPRRTRRWRTSSGKINAATATHGHAQPERSAATTRTSGRARRQLFEHQPTVRLDYNLTNNHRLSGSFSVDHGASARRTTSTRPTPGSRARRTTATSSSTRPLMSLTMRSVLSKNIDERAARRAHGVLRRVAVRLSHRASAFGQLASRLRGPGRLRDRHARQHDRLVHLEQLRAGAARRPTASTTRSRG